VDSHQVELGINLSVPVREKIGDAQRCVILSSGYGVFGYDEPVQVALIGTLEDCGIGWVQYQYVGRQGGVTTDLTLSSGLAALLAVIDWTRAQGVEEISLFGISFGATISLEASLLRSIEALLLINPVFDYVHYRTQQIGGDAMRRWGELGALEMSYTNPVRTYYRFVEEARHQDLMRRAMAIPSRVLLCQAADDPILGLKFALDFARSNANVDCHVISNADHVFAGPEGIADFIGVAKPFITDIRQRS
jgi:pimeloyl-ACP methyl ester carboxylesterase